MYGGRSNLPPGVTESMIPGNRPEDVEWDNLWDWIQDTGLTPDEIYEAIEWWIEENTDEPNIPPRL